MSRTSFLVQGLRLAIFLALSAMALQSIAATVEAGGKTITIPAPENFVHVDDADVMSFFRQFALETNSLLAVYVTPQARLQMLEGVVPDTTHKFEVQTHKGLAHERFGTPELASLKSRYLENIRQFQADTLEEARRHLAEVQEEIAREGGEDSSLNISSNVNLEPHIDEPQRFAFTQLLNLRGRNYAGQEIDYPVAVSIVVLSVRQRMLYLYVTAPADEFEWSREQSYKWSAAILSTNPPNLDEQIDRWLRRVHPSLNGGAVATEMVAALGGVVILGLFMLLFNWWASLRRQGQAGSSKGRPSR